MAATKKKSSLNGSGALLSDGQIVTMVIGYPDGGSETIDRGTVIGSTGSLVKIKKEGKESVVNMTSFYFIKAVIEAR